MSLSLSHYVASLHDSTEVVNIYGNFSTFKKCCSLPHHQVNQLTKEELVAFFCRNGVWHDLGEIAGYQVYRVEAGTGRIYMCTKEGDIKYLMGV